MLHSPVSWRSSAFSLVPLVAALGCQGSIGAHSGSGGHMGATGQAGGSITGVAGGTGNVGITGIGGGGGTVDPTVAACMASNGALNAGLTPARRLTRDQLNNTVRDLIGATGTPADALGPDEKIGPFNSNAIAVVDDTLVQQHAEIAASLAVAAKARMSADRALRPHDRHRHQHDLRDALRDRIRQARLPASARRHRDRNVRLALHAGQAGRRRGQRLPPGRRGDAAVAVLPLSPRRRRDRHAAGGHGRYYALRAGVAPVVLPLEHDADDTLFARAADGTLATDAVLATRCSACWPATRRQRRSRSSTASGSTSPSCSNQTKDATVYPRYSAQLGDAMMQELAMYSDYVVRKGDGLLKTLLTSNLSFPQGGLFDLYGVAQPAGFKVGDSVALDGSKRAGHPDAGGVPDPLGPRQPDVARPSRQAGAPQRDVRLRAAAAGEREHEPARADGDDVDARALRAARRDPNCAGCHQLIDPIGLGFETFDGIGAFRDHGRHRHGRRHRQHHQRRARPGRDVRRSRRAGEEAGRFGGRVELHGEPVVPLLDGPDGNDQRRLLDAGIRQAFNAAGGNIRELLARVAQSPAFRNVRLTPGS